MLTVYEKIISFYCYLFRLHGYHQNIRIASFLFLLRLALLTLDSSSEAATRGALLKSCS